MVRFFWKEINDPETQFNKPQATKICRSVAYSLKLDLNELCTEELRASLKPGRAAYEKYQKSQEELFGK
jgi:hypothetical protein